MKKVGILGGGQLGLLLAQSLSRLGATVVVFDPDQDAPAAKTVAKRYQAPWDDLEALTGFFSECDVVTYEFENVDAKALATLSAKKPTIPSAAVLKTTQNRAYEKSFLANAGLPHVPFKLSDDQRSLEKAVASLGFPVVIKSAFGGYDGKLQISINSGLDFDELLAKPDSYEQVFPAVVEKKLQLVLETSCITARATNGETVIFPVFENVHTNHILDTTLCPARVSPKLEGELKKIALTAAEKLGAYGLLCTEFFITESSNAESTAFLCDGLAIYINEFAPRPHNSGHVTMSACTLSQFDALARVLLNVPLSAPQLVSSDYFCMGNLLGDAWLSQSDDNAHNLNLAALSNHPEVISVVLYGKARAVRQRKMGHFIAKAQHAVNALQIAHSFRQDLCKAFSEKHH
jgi:5-(carboxyamino)imidazole ribonucleotide synthase